MNKFLQNIVADIGQLGADDMETLLFILGKDYIKNRDELTNMDAPQIGIHLLQAADLLRKRTSE